ncbi:MAG: hypothetical protein R3C56_08795 [Pirellulaceae bacterium]
MIGKHSAKATQRGGTEIIGPPASTHMELRIPYRSDMEVSDLFEDLMAKLP